MVVSKLRTVLERAGAGRIVRDGGCYQALLDTAVVDVEEAANALDRAEGAAKARELVALTPYREAGYRHLMRAEAAGGDHAEALRVFERLRELLDRELGARPDPQTRRALAEILAPVTPEADEVSGSATTARTSPR